MVVTEYKNKLFTMRFGFSGSYSNSYVLPPPINLGPPNQVVRFKAENARCAFLEGAGMRLELIEV